jgi:hypothetical protein
MPNVNGNYLRNPLKNGDNIIKLLIAQGIKELFFI